MPELTPNYKFKKPIPDKEVADITVINENFDIVDEELKKSNDAINKIFSNKLDSGTYVGDAQDLKDEIDEKFNQGTVPVSLNSAEKIVAALQGNGGLKFDESLLYLNDEGSKRKGYYYLDRLADGIFECLEQTEETVNNSAKFRDISNKASADRLDNLSNLDYKLVESGSFFNIYENALGYIVNIFANQEIPASKTLVGIFISSLQIPSSASYKIAIGSTTAFGGGWGEHKLVANIRYNRITLLNQAHPLNENVTQYTIGGVYYIPKINALN